MSDASVSILPDRGIIIVTGDEARTFLQGIVSNDTAKVSPEQAGYGAFLTPQGKYLFDFFMAECDGQLFIETERDRIPDFIKRLSLYKLRAKVTLEDASSRHCIAASYGEGALKSLSLPTTPGACSPFQSGIAFTDPRIAAAGARLIVPLNEEALLTENPETSLAEPGAYDAHRIALGLPDASRDMTVEKSVLLEYGFDELNGIDWHKGCYMGQEVTARTKHRGLLKKRLFPVSIDGPCPAPGTAIMADDREAGEMRSSYGSMGLAIIKLDYLDDAATATTPLRADGATLSPRKPAWMTL